MALSETAVASKSCDLIWREIRRLCFCIRDYLLSSDYRLKSEGLIKTKQTYVATDWIKKCAVWMCWEWRAEKCSFPDETRVIVCERAITVAKCISTNRRGLICFRGNLESFTQIGFFILLSLKCLMQKRKILVQKNVSLRTIELRINCLNDELRAFLP